MQSARRIFHELFSDTRPCTFISMPGEKSRYLRHHSITVADLRNQTLINMRKGQPQSRVKTMMMLIQGNNSVFPMSHCYMCHLNFCPQSIQVLSSSQRRQNKNRESQPRHFAGTLAELQITVVPAQCLSVLSTSNYSFPSSSDPVPVADKSKRRALTFAALCQ